MTTDSNDIIMKGVFLPNHTPFINYIDNDTKLQMYIDYINEDDFQTYAQNIVQLLNVNVNLSGIECKIIYSRYLTSILNKIVNIEINLSNNIILQLKMRVRSIGVYHGNHKCFPYVCNGH